MEKYRVDFAALAWESPVEGVRQKAVTAGGKKLRLIEYTPAMPPHWCEKGHYGCILEGRMEIEFTDGTRVFGPGDGVFIPDGVEHKHRGKVLSDVVRVIFVEDSP